MVAKKKKVKQDKGLLTMRAWLEFAYRNRCGIAHEAHKLINKGLEEGKTLAQVWKSLDTYEGGISGEELKEYFVDWFEVNGPQSDNVNIVDALEGLEEEYPGKLSKPFIAALKKEVARLDKDQPQSGRKNGGYRQLIDIIHTPKTQTYTPVWR